MEQGNVALDRRERNVVTVEAFARAELTPFDRWIRTKGHPDSLALCVIDSIYSTGQHYNAVKNVIANYKAYRSVAASNPVAGGSDSIKDLLNTFDAVGGADVWAEQVAKNRKPAHTKPGAQLKAEVVRQAAELLQGKRVFTVTDFRGLNDDAVADLHHLWKRLPSQRSGITFNYVLILAGRQSIKVDRMVRKFAENVPGATLSGASDDEILATLTEVATRLGVTASDLDHVVWRYASNREFLLADPEAAAEESLAQLP